MQQSGHHPFRNALFVLLLAIITSPSLAQPTYKQHCGCEYIIDGKCAYTLLLPLSSSALDIGNSGTTGNTNSCSSNTPGPTIEKNLTDFRDQLHSMQSQVSQLQSLFMNLQTRAINESALVVTLNEQQARLLDFKDNLDQLFLALNDVAANIEQQHEHSHTELENAQRHIIALAMAHNRTVERLNEVETTLRNIGSNGGGGGGVGECKRGLLVSGQRELPIENIQVSSMYDATHGTNKVRIHADGKPGSWCAFEPNTDYEWVQFDLGESSSPVLGIVTRGRPDFTQWVTAYRVQYADQLPEGDDQSGWTTYTDVVGMDMEFEGNSDSNTAQVNMLWQPIHARYIRIWPLKAEKNFCMRADVIGCIDS